MHPDLHRWGRVGRSPAIAGGLFLIAGTLASASPITYTFAGSASGSMGGGGSGTLAMIVNAVGDTSTVGFNAGSGIYCNNVSSVTLVAPTGQAQLVGSFVVFENTSYGNAGIGVGTCSAFQYDWFRVSSTLFKAPASYNLSGAFGPLTVTPSYTDTTHAITFQQGGSQGTITLTSQSFTTFLASLGSSTELSIITATPLPDAGVGLPYTLSFAAAGGAGGYTWSVVNGSTGELSLSPDGVLSGTPTVMADYTFTVEVTDTLEATAGGDFTLHVGPPPLTITTPSPLPSGMVGTPYSLQLTATGGAGGYTWNVSHGGTGNLTLSASGLLSGTPMGTGDYLFGIQVTDSASTVVQKDFTLHISASPVSITTSSPLPDGRVGVPYSLQFTATGGPGGYTWILLGGSPGNLSLAANGLLSGTPTGSGDFLFTVKVTDSASNTAQRSFSLHVNPPALSITSTSPLPAGAVGAPYSFQFSATGGAGALTWSLVSGSTDGLSLSPGGLLSGTPAGSGDFGFTVQVVDSASGIAQGSFSLHVNPPLLTITSTSPLPSGTVGVFYSYQFTATGGTGALTWSVSHGGTPNLTMSASGLLSGTPNATGDFGFGVQVTDSARNTAEKDVSISINPSGFTITSTSPMPSGTVGVPYSFQFNAAGGTGALTWSMVGGSAGGLSLSASGLLSGTPAVSGDFMFSVQVTDGGSNTAQKGFSFHVDPAGAPSFTAWIPVASHKNGLNQSRWRSDLGLLNPGPATAHVQLSFSGPDGVVTQALSVPSAAQTLLVDVVGLLPATGSGPMQVTSDQQLVVTTRTYNQVSRDASCYPNGTQGQDYPALTPTDGLGAGQSAYLAGLSENDAYRTNIGLVNMGQGAATVTVELHDPTGTLLTSYEVDLDPGTWAQETQPFMNKAGTTSIDGGYAKVTVSSGFGVFALASVIDNVTNDPTTVAMHRWAPATP